MMTRNPHISCAVPHSAFHIITCHYHVCNHGDISGLPCKFSQRWVWTENGQVRLLSTSQVHLIQIKRWYCGNGKLFLPSSSQSNDSYTNNGFSSREIMEYPQCWIYFYSPHHLSTNSVTPGKGEEERRGEGRVGEGRGGKGRNRSRWGAHTELLLCLFSFCPKR